ncbi:MAG: hypothetical protein K1X53_02845 [Candidatus Sumerlaeaceae bacterium]|nr:hypothetical protein [Candidatus Sumerlaeaceae bacterium]
MSLILDALHRARRDRDDPAYNNTRALDPQHIRAAAPAKKPSRLLIGSLIACTVLSLGLAGFVAWYAIRQLSRFTELKVEGGAAPKSTLAGTKPAAVVAPTPATAEQELPVVAPSNAQLQAAIQPPTDLPPPPVVPVAANKVTKAPDTPVPTDAAPKSARPDEGPTETAAPTQPAKPATPSERLAARSKKGFSLGTILFDENSKIAVINGTMLHEGQTHDDFKVLKITRNKVTVQRDGEDPVVLSTAQ